MKTDTLVRSVVVSVMAISAGCGETSEMPPVSDASLADVRSVDEGNAAFALDLYAHVRTGEGNVVCSPYSISSALAMTYAGARNNTKVQMARVLHFGLDADRLLPALARSTLDLTVRGAGGRYRLAVANRLWGQSGYAFLQEFLSLNARFGTAGVQTVDFAHAEEVARETINAWVEEQTLEKIKDLLNPEDLNPLTKLVLTNAIYFKGSWLSQFDRELTRDGRFSVSASTHLTVPMMRQGPGAFLVGRQEGVGLLELPYVGNDLAMLILLPDSVEGLASVEAQLDGRHLKMWIAALQREALAVALPRFRITQRLQLAKTLGDMGMSDAFGPQADFSGMDGGTSLSISAVIHKAFIDVNEEGTEAAAATAVVVGLRSMPRSFVVDRPFVFMIRDKKTGSIIFIGRVVNPLL
jgi:serpin B